MEETLEKAAAGANELLAKSKQAEIKTNVLQIPLRPNKTLPN